MVKTLNVFGVSRYFEIGLKFTLIGPKKVEPTRKLLLNASKMAQKGSKWAQKGPKLFRFQTKTAENCVKTKFLAFLALPPFLF